MTSLATFPPKVTQDKFLAIPDNFSTNEWLLSLLQKTHAAINAADKYLTVSFFLNGSAQVDKALMSAYRELNAESLTKLEASFRLTNVQLISPEIKTICRELYQQSGTAVTCNLYFTPRKKINCFDFHADMQQSLIVQLQGRKNWTFPLENQECLRTVNFFDQLVLPEHLTYQQMTITPGSQLFVPFGIVHKAELEGEHFSVHLTFAFHTFMISDFWDAYLKEAMASKSVSSIMNEDLSRVSPEVALSQLFDHLQNMQRDEFLSKFEEKKAEFTLKTLKQGRLYRTTT